MSSTFLFQSCESGGPKQAVIETEYGKIVVELYDSTPQHRDNFVKLVKEGFYDSLLFHRVIPNFMIQGGDPDSKTAGPGDMIGMGGPGYELPAEIGAKHFRGALAAARMPDQANPQRKSNGSQFYIVQGRDVDEDMLNQSEQIAKISYTEEERQRYLQEGGFPLLDGQYTVFGEVVSGMETVDEIANQPTGANKRPAENIVMNIRMQ